MKDLLIKKLVDIKEFTIGEYSIGNFELNAGEWVCLRQLPNDFSGIFRELLLLGVYESGGTKILDTLLEGLDKKKKQELRRQISYWPKNFVEFANENYIKSKQYLLNIDTSDTTVKGKHFLEHLMLRDDIEEGIKNCIYAALMNGPRLLIIDEALDHLSAEQIDIVLSALQRYSHQTGLAVVFFTESESIQKRIKAREFAIDDQKNLVELMMYQV